MRIRQEVWAHLDQLAAYREGKRVRDAKDCAIVVGILLDKLLVLEQRDQAGGAPDSASAVSRLWELVDAAEGRAAGNG